jgi:4-diphosphocytidyl-2-C-methyl-D-erythritol kinase
VRATVTAPAKINLALVVGPRRDDGKHELVTVYEQIALEDTLMLESADGLEIAGFPADTLVTLALMSLAEAAGVAPRWRLHIEKGIPIRAGLGGGSSDAAAALRLANATLAEPLDASRLHELAAALGADVPLFLTSGPQLGQGDGTELTPLELPRDYAVLVLLPNGATKHSTKAVYDAFDDRSGETGFAERRDDLLGRVSDVSSLTDIAAWPRNDLAQSSLAGELERLGAVRADVSGAGPALYGLFESEADARRAAAALGDRGAAWVVFPAWYG